ncbi:hypothetical protein TNCV_4167811 [Trichonephila clavipes]|nr:hypothetical protein TNCV_4167811 [Trichonephila clavipes]
MSAAIPNILQPGALVLFEKTQGSRIKVLLVPGSRSMKYLAVHVHFLRCGGLLDGRPVEGVLSIVFVNPNKSIRQASNNHHSVRTRRCTRVTDLNFVNQSTPCILNCGVLILTNEVSVKILSSAIAEYVWPIRLDPKNLGEFSHPWMNS